MALAAVMALSVTGALASSAPDWTEYDALIAEIKSTTDFVNREALMHQAEDMLMETGALLPIYYYNDIFMVKEDVEGYYYNALAPSSLTRPPRGIPRC